jgi:hypothetical protein
MARARRASFFVRTVANLATSRLTRLHGVLHSPPQTHAATAAGGKVQMATHDTWADAIIAAKARARLNGRNVAYAVQWPLGHYTDEENKPSLRQPNMRVLECDCTGAEYLA